MFCTQCGSPLAEGMKFCGSCGTPVTTAAPQATVTPPAAPGQRRAVAVPNFFANALEQMSSWGSLSRAWKAPLIGGLLSLALAFGACVGLVAIGHQVFPSDDSGGEQSFKQAVPPLEGGGATFFGFQRVAVNLELQEIPESSGFGENLDAGAERGSVRVVFSPLGGLLLVGLALVVGGLWTWRLQKPGQTRAFDSVLRMAIVFAAASFALSFVLPIRELNLEAGSFSSSRSTLTYEPSHIGALFWPFAWAIIFVSLGTFIAGHRGDWRRQLWTLIDARSRNWAMALRAALSGLIVGLLLVIIAGVAAAAVVIGLHTSEAGEIFSSGKNIGGMAEGVVVGLPHAAGAGLLGSMGVPAHYENRGTDVDSSGTLSIFGRVSRERFGRDTFSVPRYALGGLAIALICTMVAGYRAARAGADDASRAIRSALMAAALLTICLWIVAFFIGGHFRFSFTSSDTERSMLQGGIGASPVATIFLPLLWAVGGGLLGAFLYLQKNGLISRRVVESQPVAAAAPTVAAGTASDWRCASCGAVNRQGGRFCHACGRPVVKPS